MRALVGDAKDIIATIPAGRLGIPKEFGDTCAFLCSVLAAYITGQNVLIDGGFCMNTLWCDDPAGAVAPAITHVGLRFARLQYCWR